MKAIKDNTFVVSLLSCNILIVKRTIQSLKKPVHENRTSNHGFVVLAHFTVK